MMKRFSKINLILIILTCVGAILHFYNLNWGAPFYFHPDERNIASSVSQLQFPYQMNPHFFAYGSLPIYTIYFTRLLINFFHIVPAHNDPFVIAILVSRFYSALFATALIPILFFIGKKFKDEKTGLITAIFATASVGFVQFAHFGTFEMWLTLFSVLLFWVCLQKLSKKMLLLMGLLFGILVATKISSLVLLPIFLLIIPAKTEIKKFRKHFFVTTVKSLGGFLFVCIIAGLIYFLSNPFVFLDSQSFHNSMQYESSLALGTLPVFYTGEFFNTIPVIFQFIKIYPFLINPLLTIILIPSFVYLVFQIVKRKQSSSMILASFFLILFLSQAFLFAKWTRYMIPTLPFIFLIIALALTDFLKNQKQFNKITMIAIVLINSLFAFSYFVTAFVRPDTRVQAYHFALTTIPTNAFILSEVYDLGIVPFNQSYANITLFNFYDLDNNSPDATPAILKDQLSSRSYIILPSQRILKTRLLQQKQFPLANTFYQSLTDGKLGYQKIYETPCDIFCKITYLGNPIWSFEETANVFDRPTVIIFKKVINKT